MGQDPVSQTILYLIIILVAAKLFGELAERLGQPALLGELVAGVILGGSVLGWVKISDPLNVLAELGVILLLFEIGLESDLEEFLRVGPSALMVATVGVICPFVAGYFVSKALGLQTHEAIFMGATLTATSVGITARTLTDLKQLRTSEAKIILGAAVIDDVMGLVILAVVTGLVVTGSISGWQVTKTTLLAIVFLVGSILLGIPLAPKFMNLAKKLRTRGILTISALIFCLGLAFIAHQLQLATIVGAFAAGLVLARTEDVVHIQDRVKPLADILIPVFFVKLGVLVNLSVLNPLNPANRGTLAIAGLLVLVAVVMKVFAGLGVLGRTANRLVVGVGMIPRGEFGLIFAQAGLAGKVIKDPEYVAILAVVIITTFITPPLLKVVLRHTKTTPTTA